MKISKAELIELEACKRFLQRFAKQTDDTCESVEITSLIGGKNTKLDLLWLAGKKLTREEIEKFACECALINIEKIKPFTDNYELIVDFLNNPSKSKRDLTSVVSKASYQATGTSTHPVTLAVVNAHASVRAIDISIVASYAHYATGAAVTRKVNDLLVKLFNREYKK